MGPTRASRRVYAVVRAFSRGYGVVKGLCRGLQVT